nr:reverse transcriptase domain-containing protein [Tanacetum cinerariifolium]
MTAILKQFQATLSPASLKSIEEICVTCGGAHPYYQCLAADENTFPEPRDNIQGYVAATIVNYNQGNSDYRPLALLSNKEKLFELANTTLNENFSAVILKKLPKKLRDPGKFLIPCGFSELKCKALANLELISMSNIYDDSSEDFLENLFTTNDESGNLTFSSHLNLTSPKVKDDVFDLEGGNVLLEKLLDPDSTKDLYPPHNINPLSGSATSSSSLNQLLKEFTDELALITFPLGNDDLPFDIESDLKDIEYLLHHDPIKDMDSILKDSVDEDNLVDLYDNLTDTMPEMFTNETCS